MYKRELWKIKSKILFKKILDNIFFNIDVGKNDA